MKFQKLTIHNIASIEDAVIDFEAQPLASSEVFLITGKTGAGKSTILDAICLALYADTPRLDGTRMQGGTKDGKNDVSIDDPRQLMRRNTGEAFVSLTFTGSNGVHYEARWSVARAHKKVDGNLMPKQWQLRNIDTDQVLSRDLEIKAEIRAAIGLDFNQFCRTTMLAQGEFTRFLNSQDNEKAEILEKITGVDVYSKIGAKVFDVCGQKKKDWENAQALVAGTRTLSEDEMAEKQAALADLDRRQREVKAASESNEAKRNWLVTDDELVQKVAVAKEEQEKAKREEQSEDFASKKSLCHDWDATHEARQWMNAVQKAADERARQQGVLCQLAEQYAEVLCGQKFIEQEVLRITDELGKTEEFLAAEASKAAMYDNAQTIAGYLRTIAEGRQEIVKKQGEAENEQDTLDTKLQPTLTQAQETASAAKQTLEKESAEVKQQEAQVEALNLPNLRAQRDKATALLGNIKTAHDRIETLVEAKLQMEKKRQSLSDRQKTVEEKKAASQAMDAPIHDAKLKMEVRNEDLNRQKDTIDKFASAMRLKLHVGDTCPVCRQRISAELPHEEELSALVAGLQQACDEAEKELKALSDEKIKLDADIKSEQKGCERDAKALAEDTSVANAEAKVQEACAACGIGTYDEATPSALTALETQTKDDKEKLDARIKEGESQEAVVKSRHHNLETMRKEAERLQLKAQEAEKKVNECRGRIDKAKTLISTRQSLVDDATVKASALITSDSWETDWHESPTEFSSALTEAATRYNKAQQQRQMLQSDLQTAKGNHENVDAVIGSIVRSMPEWRDIAAGSAKSIDGLQELANDIDHRVTAAITQLKSAGNECRTNQSELDAFLAQNKTLTIERLKQLAAFSADEMKHRADEVKTVEDNVMSKGTLLENAQKNLSEHRQKQPELTEADTLEELKRLLADTGKELDDIAEKKGAINQELKADSENRQRLDELIRDAEQKNAVYQQWSKLNQMIGDQNGNKFRKIAQSYVLTSLIHSANAYMQTLTDRYTLKVTPGTFVISIEDAYQGYVSRAASTISGGESFLVSLSLALALSDIGQTLSVDTLFIDEGFGTLSGVPLQNAINTLRTLHTKAGRHVGIISHVEELQERIPVQIQVNQEGNNSASKICIVG